jgi:glycosyltransferase involved in cell wall biosynthesis
LERKGQLDLVKAMPAVLNKFPEAVLLIAGEGPFRARLEEEVQHLQLQDHVRLLGTRKDIPQWLSIADCFAFPSYYEGLPGALIEAMMTGLPIVASSIPENQECVTQESAMLFSPGDVAQMAKAINHIMEDADHAQRLAKEARAVAQTKFELDAVVQQYEDTYDAFMQRK